VLARTWQPELLQRMSSPCSDPLELSHSPNPSQRRWSPSLPGQGSVLCIPVCSQSSRCSPGHSPAPLAPGLLVLTVPALCALLLSLLLPSRSLRALLYFALLCLAIGIVIRNSDIVRTLYREPRIRRSIHDCCRLIRFSTNNIALPRQVPYCSH